MCWTWPRDRSVRITWQSANTLIGFILLLTGATGALSAILPPEGVILILSLMGLAGAALARQLPKANT